jgi:hypothetical protein
MSYPCFLVFIRVFLFWDRGTEEARIAIAMNTSGMVWHKSRVRLTLNE